VNEAPSLHKKYALISILVVALALTLPWLDRPFHTRGEPREALVAQSMLINNNWISPPAYNGAVPSKPPFSHWLTALASLPTGEVSEFTARLPSAIAFILFSVALYIFLERRTTQRSAALASLILLSSFEWFRGAVTCRVDTILSTSMAGALLALFAWKERGCRGFPFLAAGLIACAALTKGPIGIALPLAIYMLYDLVSGPRNVRNIVRIGLKGAGIAVPVVAVVSLWYVAGYLQRGDAFIDKIYYENFQRLTSSMEDEPHKHAAPYMLLMLAVGFLPWTIVWVSAAIRGFSKGNYTLRALSELWKSASELQKFSCIAAAFIFVFFCIPSSKRSVYIMPAYPFIAILAAESVRCWGDRSKKLIVTLTKCLQWFAVIVALAGIVAAVFPFRVELEKFPAAMGQTLSLWRILVLLALLALSLRWPRALSRAGAELHFATTFILTVVIASVAIAEPIFQQLSPREWLQSDEVAAQINLPAQERMYSFGSESYVVSFYLKKPIFSATKDLAPGSLIVVEQRNLERLTNELSPNVREVARFSSGLEPRKKELVFVEVGAPLSQSGTQ